MEDNQVLPSQILETNPRNEISFQGLFNIRTAKPEDHNFIMSTFLRGIYYGEGFFSRTPKALFMDRYKRVVQALVISPDILITVACLPEDSNVVLGYAVLNSTLDTVSFIYVKKDWRNKGIAKSLIPQSFKYIVPQHVTKLGWELLRKYDVTENPFF